MKRSFFFFLLSCFFIAFPVYAHEEKPDPYGLMEECHETYASIKDYTAVFKKEQRIRGRLRKPETIFVKFKKPFSIYMKWTKRPDKGKEVIFVEGENKGKIIAHPGGLLALVTQTMKLNPTHPLAMGGNLKPITHAGMGNMTDSLIRIFHLAKQNGDLKAVCKGKINFNGRDVWVIERNLPPKKIYPNTRAVIYIDAELKLPVYYASYGEGDELLEKYIYSDLKLNVGLTKRDFDKSNPEYNYPLL